MPNYRSLAADSAVASQQLWLNNLQLAVALIAKNLAEAIVLILDLIGDSVPFEVQSAAEVATETDGPLAPRGILPAICGPPMKLIVNLFQMFANRIIHHEFKYLMHIRESNTNGLIALHQFPQPTALE